VIRFDRDKVEAGATKLLEGLGVDLQDENFIGTPERLVRMYADLFEGLYREEELRGQIEHAIYNESYDQIIAVTNIRTTSACPHHLSFVRYTSSVGYIPKGKVIGASKLVG
jgi:GTP cyclohydrolase I